MTEEKLTECMLYFSHKQDKWIAPSDFVKEGKDGCFRKICGFKTCHNYGKGFSEPDRLIVFNPKSMTPREV